MGSVWRGPSPCAARRRDPYPGRTCITFSMSLSPWEKIIEQPRKQRPHCRSAHLRPVVMYCMQRTKRYSKKLGDSALVLVLSKAELNPSNLHYATRSGDHPLIAEDWVASRLPSELMWANERE